MSAVENNKDIYKCQKINEVIPKIIDSINELTSLHDLYKMDLSLKISKRKFESIPAVNEPFSEQQIEEFRGKLYDALMSLSSGINLTSNVDVLNDEQKSELISILADISAYQDDINNVASK